MSDVNDKPTPEPKKQTGQGIETGKWIENVVGQAPEPMPQYPHSVDPETVVFSTPVEPTDPKARLKEGGNEE